MMTALGESSPSSCGAVYITLVIVFAKWWIGRKMSEWGKYLILAKSCPYQIPLSGLLICNFKK